MGRRRTAKAPAARPLPESRTDVPPPRRAAAIVVAVALVLLTLAAYTPVWRFEFISIDDPQYVAANPNIAHGLTWDSLAWAFTTRTEANWHPLTWISHALDVSLFGLAAGGHHLTNLLLHVASTLLLFLVMRRMTGALWKSAFVAGVFGLHPLHVESVAWVAERKDVLSAFFFMLTVGAYVRYTEKPATGRYLLVAICLALGLMAKAMLVTVPLVLLLLDFWRVRSSSKQMGEQADWRALIVQKVPLFALAAASSLVTFLVQRWFGAVRTLDSFPIGLRVQNALVSYLDYLHDVVWPAGLGVFYPFPQSVPGGRVAVAALVMAAITLAAWRLARRAPYFPAGWFWFVGMLVPVIGLVQVGGQARADRYMYLPLIGLTIVVAWGSAAWATTVWRRRAAGAAGAVVIAACTMTTHAQTQYWRDNFTLWTRTAAVTDHMNNFGVYYSLGEYLRETGRPKEAIERYEASLRKNPGYADSYLGLGRVLVATGQPERAAGALAEAVRLNPGSAEARMALGLVLSDLGRPADAAVHLSEAVRLRPDVAEGHWHLALALANSGQTDKALPAFAEAVRLKPGLASIRNDYGWALARQGQPAAAIEQLSEALRLKSDFVDAHHNLGRVLIAEGRTDDGLRHLSEAVRLEPSFIDARLSLAIALLRIGRVADGVKELREVQRLDPRNATAARLLASIGK